MNPIECRLGSQLSHQTTSDTGQGQRRTQRMINKFKGFQVICKLIHEVAGLIPDRVKDRRS